MSAANTPGRPRGMLVPGIDTRGAYENHNFSPRVLSNSWPMTPPQSALELRRPSLAYSSMSDASTSGTASSCDYSQPATPVHSLGLTNDHFGHNWNADSANTTSIPERCSLGQASQSMYYPNLVHAMSGVEVSTYSPARQPHAANTYGSQNESLMGHTWTPAHSAALGLDSSMKTNLFQTEQALEQGINGSMNTSSMYVDPASSMHHPSLEPSVFQEFNNVAMYPPQQVVIPSQVNPHEDYKIEQYPGYDANESFDSSVTGYSGWDSVGPQSPESAYYGPSEDDEFVMVNHSVSETPDPRQHFTGNSPSHVSRKPARKSRKATQTSQLLAERELHGVTVRYEGKPWERDSEGKAIARDPAKSKSERCMLTNKDGTKCLRKFHRLEHLKRHLTSHYPGKYPCPFEGCPGLMSRIDNAGDHFKSHLAKQTKGKRNKHYSFEQVTAALRGDERWDQKKLSNMLTNLKKWHVDYERKEAEAANALETDDNAHADSVQRAHNLSYKL